MSLASSFARAHAWYRRHSRRHQVELLQLQLRVQRENERTSLRVLEATQRVLLKAAPAVDDQEIEVDTALATITQLLAERPWFDPFDPDAPPRYDLDPTIADHVPPVRRHRAA